MNKKEHYEKMLKSGFFWEFYPELSGNWEKDKDLYKLPDVDELSYSNELNRQALEYENVFPKATERSKNKLKDIFDFLK